MSLDFLSLYLNTVRHFRSVIATVMRFPLGFSLSPAAVNFNGRQVMSIVYSSEYDAGSFIPWRSSFERNILQTWTFLYLCVERERRKRKKINNRCSARALFTLALRISHLFLLRREEAEEEKRQQYVFFIKGRVACALEKTHSGTKHTPSSSFADNLNHHHYRSRTTNSNRRLYFTCA